MSDFQQPLFELFNMDRAFERRLAFARQILREDWEVWMDYNRIDNSETVECLYCPYDALELDLDRIVYEEITTDVAGIKLQASIPYSGDSYLWHFYPDQPDYSMWGETFRGNLVLGERAQCEAEARDGINRRLARFQSVIDRQLERISEFEDLVPSLLQIELIKLKGSSLGGILETA